MQCFYMGSMRTNNGIGKCKSNHGKEYDAESKIIRYGEVKLWRRKLQWQGSPLGGFA
jgi:hypothetical protein